MENSKKYIILIFLLLFSCVSLQTVTPKQEPLPTLDLLSYSGPRLVIAVADLMNKSEFDDPRIGKGITQMFITALVNSGRFRLVERQTEVMDLLLKEQKLVKIGIVDPSTVAKVGKMIGAKAFILGEITEFGIRKEGVYVGLIGSKTITTRVVIDARIVGVETGEIISGAQGIGLSSTQTGGVALTFEFGTEGFDETSIGIATRKAVYQAVKQFALWVNKRYKKEPPKKVELSIDVDEVPQLAKKENKEAIAIIIGIEDYKYAPPATFANSDATIFYKYARNVLGIPERNIYIRINEDATKGEFDKIFGENGWIQKRIVKDKSDIIIYFSGHGAPSIKTGKPYIVPYDGDPNYAELTAYPLSTFYRNLNKLGAKSVTVFLDACFSGVSRDGAMLLADARPFSIVKIPRPVEGITVFTSASGTQISSGYKEKRHGLFTYYLLKGLQGNADLNGDKKIMTKELAKYINENVEEQARYLDREQTPTVINPGEKILIKLK